MMMIKRFRMFILQHIVLGKINLFEDLPAKTNLIIKVVQQR